MTDKDIEIRSLAGVAPEAITEAFLDAFADYAITLDAASLADMLKRRGARMDLSFAAMDGSRIVSFILNGIGEYGGLLTAYDTGTGTVNAYRGMGLTDRIFAASVGPLARAGVKQYLLEVLTDNHPAVKIYSRQGFSCVRDFECFGADVKEAVETLRRKPLPEVTIEQTTVESLSSLSPMMDFEPSWQNTLASLNRNASAMTCLVAYVHGHPAGFAASETAYGDVSLLAVDPAHRRRGIGSRLLLELLSRMTCERAKALNVDAGCTTMPPFLRAAAFRPTCRQHEMIRPLP
ncbi:MAG: GNAT family N-acetyltransferase [Bacteroides sp.]|nr:GNAT family N-acetyltransferase [Bacteroides sp.]